MFGEVSAEARARVGVDLSRVSAGPASFGERGSPARGALRDRSSIVEIGNGDELATLFARPERRTHAEGHRPLPAADAAAYADGIMRFLEMSNRQSSYEPPVVVQGERVPAPMGRVPPSKLDSPRGAVV